MDNNDKYIKLISSIIKKNRVINNNFIINILSNTIWTDILFKKSKNIKLNDKYLLRQLNNIYIPKLLKLNKNDIVKLAYLFDKKSLSFYEGLNNIDKVAMYNSKSAITYYLINKHVNIDFINYLLNNVNNSLIIARQIPSLEYWNNLFFKYKK